MRQVGIRTAATVLLVSALGSITPVEGQAGRANTNGGVEGIVLLAESTQPVSNVEVSLIQQATRGQAGSRTTSTATNGRFTIQNVVPGTYNLRIQKNGYFAATRSGAVDHITMRVTIAPRQQVRDLEFRLVQGGLLKGRLIDTEGKPVSGVPVSALLAAYTPEGYRRFSGPASNAASAPGAARTNEKGEYNLSVPHGNYYVRAAYYPSPQLPMLGQTWVGQLALGTFYPGVTDGGLASAVRVPLGAEVTADMTVSPPKSLNISGKIVAAFGSPIGSLGNFNVLLFPRDPNALTYLTPPSLLVLPNSNGRFSLASVAPGEYYLAARGGAAYYAQIPIDVKDSNIEDLTLEVAPPVNAKVQVTIQGTASVFSFDAIAGLGLRHEFGASPVTARIAADGTGQLSNLAPGRYVFQTLPLPGDSYVADVRQGDRSVLSEVIAIEIDSLPLQVFINPAGGRIEGEVRDSNGSTVPGFITLVPQGGDGKAQTTVNYRVAAEASGRFTLRNIPPGEYKIFAWESIPPGADANAAFMKNFDSFGTRVTVPPGGNQTSLELPRIAAEIANRN
jgi:5-hydroxyisourate hydrolase-like protein (transthyretin family)